MAHADRSAIKIDRYNTIVSKMTEVGATTPSEEMANAYGVTFYALGALGGVYRGLPTDVTGWRILIKPHPNG